MSRWQGREKSDERAQSVLQALRMTTSSAAMPLAQHRMQRKQRRSVKPRSDRAQQLGFGPEVQESQRGRRLAAGPVYLPALPMNSSLVIYPNGIRYAEVPGFDDTTKQQETNLCDCQVYKSGTDCHKTLHPCSQHSTFSSSNDQQHVIQFTRPSTTGRPPSRAPQASRKKVAEARYAAPDTQRDASRQKRSHPSPLPLQWIA